MSRTENSDPRSVFYFLPNLPNLSPPLFRECPLIVKNGQGQARGRPEAGQRQAGEAGMNEEASAGEEEVQNRPTIFRKGGRIVKLINMNKLLNPPAPMEEPLPHDSE